MSTIEKKSASKTSTARSSGNKATNSAANTTTKNSADNGHCPNCKDKDKDKKEPEKKTYNEVESFGGTPGHRGEQLYFPSLQHSSDAPPSDEEFTNDDAE